MDLSKLSERLIAEQAVETLRAPDRAADDAPHGRGCRSWRRRSTTGGSTAAVDHGERARRPRRGAKKGVPCARACPTGGCGGRAKFPACEPRTVLTTVGTSRSGAAAI